MHFLFNIKNLEVIEIQLKKGKSLIEKVYLTVKPDFDILLIRGLDKLIRNNKIDKLSLKNLKIQGKIRSGAVSGMILAAVVNALKT